MDYYTNGYQTGIIDADKLAKERLVDSRGGNVPRHAIHREVIIFAGVIHDENSRFRRKIITARETLRFSCQRNANCASSCNTGDTDTRETGACTGRSLPARVIFPRRLILSAR